ncbi:MAG: Glu-tRNA(Gln) amidotransferase subunit GatE [Candidatus Thermoplasmatota archaeon]|nr:Glu-tRNA(Gln) amidotransferase subunit GatE [Candidatus Thermoplasmatota archaeon]MEE3269782.1 Glu-tRNA(Gln) amidotransferase subunit GatE [Candidatus Thermoplasmatota archaeon]
MQPLGDIREPGELDPVSLGFMCGLEIHQHLDTGKLHSRMASQLFDYSIDEIPEGWTRSSRRLRASEGESGKIDVAARFEQRRNRSFVYIQPPNAGLIELDEAPPLKHDDEAIDIVLTMAGMMGAKPVSTLQAMRKTVVDGSNTSGFQRTTLIATDGTVQTEEGEVGVDVICLEEDSARKLDTRPTPSGEVVYYTLDRLGMPLVEIATAPDVKSPEHARETALALGTLLRDTRRVRRGLGSIRQDLNVSLACGDRVEIKGCQDLDWIPRIIRLEMARQLHMYRLSCELRSEADLPPLPTNRAEDEVPVENRVAAAAAARLPLNNYDLSGLFKNCESEMIRNALSSGSKTLAVPLLGFAGKLGSKQTDTEDAQLPRLGRELASAAKVAGVAGIFHSDELPAYGISSSEVESVREALSLSKADAFALCVAPEWQAELALESVVLRARLAYHRIPQEVRNVVIRRGQPEDGTTTAMRPLPGGARMYPETDIPVVQITEKHWTCINEELPLTSEQRKERLQGLGVSENQIEAILGSEMDDVLMMGVEGDPCGCPPLPAKAWASAILDNLRSEVAEGSDRDETEVPWPVLTLAIHSREMGVVTREGVAPMARTLWLEGPAIDSGFDQRLDWFSAKAEENGFTPADTGAVEAAVEEVLAENADMVRDRGMGAMGPLMGAVMGKLGGSADGKAVSGALRSKITELSSKED